jgi:hypothetical protein
MHAASNLFRLTVTPFIKKQQNGSEDLKFGRHNWPSLRGAANSIMQASQGRNVWQTTLLLG